MNAEEHLAYRRAHPRRWNRQQRYHEPPRFWRGLLLATAGCLVFWLTIIWLVVGLWVLPP